MCILFQFSFVDLFVSFQAFLFLVSRTWGPDPADPPDPAMLSALALALPLGAAAAECLDPRDFGAVPGDPGSSAGPNWEKLGGEMQKSVAGGVCAFCCWAVSGGEVLSLVFLPFFFCFFPKAWRRVPLGSLELFS